MIADLTVIDGHVHVYECFDMPTLLHHALQNLRAASGSRGAERRVHAVLILAESNGCDWFARTSAAISGGASRGASAGWLIQALADDPCSLRATAPGGGALLIVAGFQAVTEEGLEVLALATRKRPPDGQPAEDTVSAIVEDDAVPVLPWGAGKWIGRRGGCVERLLRSAHGECLLLADNAGRPWFWPRGRLFSLAESMGTSVISGSDPLPLAGEEQRVGRAGFIFDARPSDDTPTLDLKKLLRGGGARTFGRPESALRFWRNQIRMRFLQRDSR